MTENTAASKPKTAPVKKAPAARKPAMRKPAAARKPVTRTRAAAPVKAAVKSAPAVSQVKPAKKSKKEKKAQGKSKVVRDSFTMPQTDYAQIAALKQVCQKAGLHVKKSELLRAGLQALSKMSVAQLERAIVQLAPIKTGRPKKP
ncbi:MAG: hypothetical protein GC139_02415 [Sideroxydans sp.]|nr:hypothetical protein [Sideroxydans sp.]